MTVLPSNAPNVHLRRKLAHCIRGEARECPQTASNPSTIPTPPPVTPAPSVIPSPSVIPALPPSFPRKREPRVADRPRTPTVCGRGRASAAKRGGGEASARNYPMPTRHSRERGNPGRPLLPSFPRRREPRSPPTPVCGRGRASAAKRGGGEAAGRNYPLPQPVIPANAGTQDAPLSVIPAQAGTSQPTPLPSAGGDAQAQQSAGEEKRPPATTPATPTRHSRERGNPGRPLRILPKSSPPSVRKS